MPYVNARVGPRMPAKTATSAVRGTLEIVVAGLLAFLADDLGDLVCGLVDLPVLVHHDVVVLRRGGHLDLRVPQAHRALLRRFGPAMLEAALERFDRRRHDEDGQ